MSIDLGGPIDLGFNLNGNRPKRKQRKSKLPRVSVPSMRFEGQTGMRSISAGPSFDTMSSFRGAGSVRAGSSFDTSSAFKGMLARKGDQNISISKQDLQDIGVSIKKFTQGGQNLGKALAGKSRKQSRGPLQSSGVRTKQEMEKEKLEKRLAELNKPQRSNALPAQNILSGLRKRFGLS